jgi:hypothetical protein
MIVTRKKSEAVSGAAAPSQNFELSAATLGIECLDASTWTMFFLDDAAEADFLRFRNRGRVAVDIATMAIHVVYYAIVALTFETGRVIFTVLAAMRSR